MADMGGFLDILPRGDWLTLSRMRLWALAVLAASAGGLLYLVATSDGLIDYQGRPRIDGARAERIALGLVPDDFCGPSSSIGGCDLVTENFYDSWRIYVHQYRRIPNAHDWAALTHSYVILDAVGNCIANIPGTEPGARR